MADCVVITDVGRLKVYRVSSRGRQDVSKEHRICIGCLEPLPTLALATTIVKVLIINNTQW